MSRYFRFYDQDKPYFISFAVIGWIDVFTRSIYREIVIDSLNYCVKEKGLIIDAWVLMTNHVHLLMGRRTAKLQDIVRDLKKFTSVQLLDSIANNKLESRRTWMMDMFRKAGVKCPNNTHYQFWQQDNHPLEVNHEQQMLNFINYIHQNPVRSNLTEEATDWHFSSAAHWLLDPPGNSDVKLSGIQWL